MFVKSLNEIFGMKLNQRQKAIRTEDEDKSIHDCSWLRYELSTGVIGSTNHKIISIDYQRLMINRNSP